MLEEVVYYVKFLQLPDQGDDLHAESDSMLSASNMFIGVVHRTEFVLDSKIAGFVIYMRSQKSGFLNLIFCFSKFVCMADYMIFRL